VQVTFPVLLNSSWTIWPPA
jgi:hypothetical protein